MSKNKEWKIGLPNTHTDDREIIEEIMRSRGISETEEDLFLDRRVEHQTDPYLFAGMREAVDRISRAIQDGEIITIYGDFDADGVTATVLLVQYLRGIEGVLRDNVRPYIPSRLKDGYGVHSNALLEIKNSGSTLVITVDCGITSVEEVDFANEIGLDVIITDHHELRSDGVLPNTIVIDPKRVDCRYPEKMLAGVGVAYKLVEAISQSGLFDPRPFEVKQLLGFVALGTVADLVPLVGENRALVYEGLKVLNQTNKPGLVALYDVSKVNGRPISSQDIAFSLAPHINSAGRVAHAYTAAKLLFASTHEKADRLATELSELNEERKKRTVEVQKYAEEYVDHSQPILISISEDFSPGVLGLGAGKLAESYNKPSIVIRRGKESAQDDHQDNKEQNTQSMSSGSCRSVPGFDIKDALDNVASYLKSHGGHKQAAGLKLPTENLDQFIEAIQSYSKSKLEGVELKPVLKIDKEISLGNATENLHEMLQVFEPTGQNNRSPRFCSLGVKVTQHSLVGKDKATLKLKVQCPNSGNVIDAIAFRQAHHTEGDMLSQLVDVAYTIDMNHFRGRTTLQLKVLDIRPSTSEVAKIHRKIKDRVGKDTYQSMITVF